MAKPQTIDGASISPKYKDFNIVDVDYKQVNGIGIPLSILIPKNIRPGKHPIAVRWHGGGFGTGDRLMPDWYADWTLSLSLSNSAISITPDYRPLPEANGLDILADAQDFYAWLLEPSNLSTHLPANITPDLENILVTGESAGGWQALQAGFLLPKKNIRAIISHYPMIDLASHHFSGAPLPGQEKQIFTPPRPQADPSHLDSYVANLTGEEVAPNRTPPAGEINVLIMIQQGLYGKYFGTDSRLYPLEMVEKVDSFPPTWILHGTGDSVVPVEGTRKFVERMKGKLGVVPLHVTYREGEEHGFDLREDGEGWRDEGVRFVERFWPAKEDKWDGVEA